MRDNVMESLKQALDDWKMMQQTEGEEGAEWAEKFERDFYLFIDEFEKWFTSLPQRPILQEEAESLDLVIAIQDMLPGPLLLNFLNELERIMDGETTQWFD
jgi:ribonuclease HIII